jgi:4'-phosphopantetheinyl transferase
MPLVEMVFGNDRCFGLWKIEESEEWLQRQVQDLETVPANVIHPAKRLEYLAGRVLIRQLLHESGRTFRGIVKNEYGKPFLNTYPDELSMSHSLPYVAAIVDRHKPVGIDIEQPKSKLLRIAPRILHRQELADAGTDLSKHCVYWCAKESLVKYDGKKGLSFSENLMVEPFVLQPSGRLTGRVITSKATVSVEMYYRLYTDFVLVYTL